MCCGGIWLRPAGHGDAPPAPPAQGTPSPLTSPPLHTAWNPLWVPPPHQLHTVLAKETSRVSTQGRGRPDPQHTGQCKLWAHPPAPRAKAPHPGWDVSACSELTGAGGPRRCGRPPGTPAGPHTPQALTASSVKLQINLRIRETAPKIRVCSCTLSDCTKQGRIICRRSKETPPTPSVGSHPPRSVPRPRPAPRSQADAPDARSTPATKTTGGWPLPARVYVFLVFYDEHALLVKLPRKQ